MWLVSSVFEGKVPLGENENDKLLRKNEMNDLQENKIDDKQEINLDRCYSWLLVRADGAVDGKRSRHDSETSISSSTSSSLPMPQAPDGGWGWFVVLGAFTVTLICDGLSYCFGVLYAELLVQFGETHSKTSLVGSIFYGVSMLLGPFASALTTRFGCRTMTIIGGIIAFIGMILSCFATSIEMLCVTFSTIVGTGFSFCYITSVVVVAFYFDKRRALATGLAVCGTGVGTFTFAPLMDLLLVEYGWRGLFLVMSGVTLNLIVCGMLFRPLQFTESERWHMLLHEFNKIPYNREDIELLRSRFQSDSSECNSDEEVLDEEARTLSVLSLPTFVNARLLQTPSSVLMEALKNSKNPHHTLQRYMKNAMLQIDHTVHDQIPSDVFGSPVDVCTDKTVDTYITLADTSSETDVTSASLLDNSHSKDCAPSLCLPCKGNDTVHDAVASPKPVDHSSKVQPTSSGHGKQVTEKTELKAQILNGKAYTVPTNSHKENQQHKRAKFSGIGDKASEKEGKLMVKRVSGVHIGRHSAFGIHLPLYRRDIFYRRLLKNVSTQKRCTLGTSCPELSESIAPEAERGILVQKLTSFFEELCDMMKNMVEIRLFLNPFFLVFVTSNFIYYFWDDIPYMFAADHAMRKNIEQQKASFLLSVIGIFNTVGQVVFGFVGDMDINLLSVYAIVSSIAGLFVALVPVMDTYTSMSAMYGLFGFCISVSYPLTTVLLVNYLGMAKLTNAYGLLMLVQGVANLGGPPFAGKSTCVMLLELSNDV